MYRVELAPGKETIYRDEHEFTDAIVRGEVSAQSRIYHRAKSVWISVTFHPQFRRVATARPPQPMPPLQRAEWTFFRADAPGSAPRFPTPRRAR
jgi:hypothetical protein